MTGDNFKYPEALKKAENETKSLETIPSKRAHRAEEYYHSLVSENAKDLR